MRHVIFLTVYDPDFTMDRRILGAALADSHCYFIVAWIGQFVGHHLEEQRPSFFKDVQFLLIGPLWLLSDVYRKFNLKY